MIASTVMCLGKRLNGGGPCRFRGRNRRPNPEAGSRGAVEPSTGGSIVENG